MVAGARYVLLRNGPMTGNGLYVGALVRTDPRFERPDLQMNISAWSTIERTRQGIISHPHPGISISPVHLRPEARGTVRLGSADPFAPPKIHFDFMKSDYDMQVMLYGIRLARQIVRQPQAMQSCWSRKPRRASRCAPMRK